MMCVPSSTSESRFHVLAIDDSVIDRKLIERLLKTSSYQVTTVDSGSKALEFLGLMIEDDQRQQQQQQPSSLSVSVNHHNNNHEVEVNLIITDYCMPGMTGYELLRKIKEVEVNLIITDYCMPGMTGYELLRKIKESTSLKDIPVVIMSSENVPSRINRCLEEGAEEFFLKPVQLSDVNKLKPHLLKGRSTTNKEIEFDETNVATPAATKKRKGDIDLEENVISSPGKTRTNYNTNSEFSQS